MILVMAYIIMPAYRVETPNVIGRCGNKTIVNVDGRQYDVTVNEDNVVVESNTKENKQKMVLDLKGNAKIFAEDSEGNKQTATMKIDELSKNNIKALVTFEDGTTKRYDSIDDLGQDRYVGKNVASAFAMAVPIGWQLAKAAAVALAKAVVATGALAVTAYATVVVAGEVYSRLDALAKELVDTFEREKPPEDKRYFKAHIDKASNAVFIFPTPISFEEAKVRMNAGSDVYTPIDMDALKLALSAGWKPSVKENHIDTSDRPGIYYDHYHPCHRKCHIFCGKPQVKK